MGKHELDRRAFLLGTPAAVALAAQAAQSGRGNVPEARSYSLNRNWRFGGRTKPGVLETTFDDAAWETVTLPHANVRLPWHSFEEKDFQFVSAYRRRFKAPAGWQAKRVFVDFGGAMTAATVAVNGHKFPEYKGGYTPFSFEVSGHLQYGGNNVLAVEVNSTERKDIPPFGDNIDYLTFGGIYRDVQIRVVPKTFVANAYVKPVRVMEDGRGVVARVYLDGPVEKPAKLSLAIYDGNRAVAQAETTVSSAAPFHEIRIERVGNVALWEPDNPKLYAAAVRLTNGDGSTDEYRTRIGFREGRFTPAGFLLNGKHIKLRGLNRHQTYPYVGGAMPARVQRRDALVLKRDLHCNIVRTSHYPQSPDFLDCCDEIGLLVFEEIPGWQHIGDQAWQDIAVRNVGEMIRRDWNHPSIILWGVRINESNDNDAFYTRTNALAHELDDARQTGGVRYKYDSHLLEDVFTMNDFGFPLRPPNHPLYLNTEFNGHMFSTKRFDNISRVAEHVTRHVRVHDQIAGDDRYAGGIGWCAFDYNTHSNFGSGDHICYHGVTDIFRIPKPAAYVYKSQVDPKEEVVLEAGFFWSSGDRSGAGGTGRVPILSNCERLKIYYAGEFKQEIEPDRKTYPNIKYPPFFMDFGDIPLNPWGDLKVEGYIGGKLVKTLILSGTGKDTNLKVLPDDSELHGDGRDATRVVLMVTDEHGNIRPFATGAVSLTLTGPGEIIGENPFALAGGTGAVWIRARESAGTVRLTAKHPYLPPQTVEIKVIPAPPESV